MLLYTIKDVDDETILLIDRMHVYGIPTEMSRSGYELKAVKRNRTILKSIPHTYLRQYESFLPQLGCGLSTNTTIVPMSSRYYY